MFAMFNSSFQKTYPVHTIRTTELYITEFTLNIRTSTRDQCRPRSRLLRCNLIRVCTVCHIVTRQIWSTLHLTKKKKKQKQSLDVYWNVLRIDIIKLNYIYIYIYIYIYTHKLVIFFLHIFYMSLLYFLEWCFSLLFILICPGHSISFKTACAPIEDVRLETIWIHG